MDSVKFEGVNVYTTKDKAYMKDEASFVKETARLWAVEGSDSKGTETAKAAWKFIQDEAKAKAEADKADGVVAKNENGNVVNNPNK